jgi:hypothetical protein
VQLLKHYRSHERQGDVPGIPAAAPRRRRNVDSGADELKEEAEEGGEEAKTLVCDICAGVFGSEKALSLHLSAHKQAGLRIRIHFIWIRIRIQHFRLNTHPNPRALMTKNFKKY